MSKSQEKRMNKKIYIVDVPSSYVPRNWAMRKSRFGPAIVQPSSSPTNEGHKRHILTAEERGQLLNEKTKPKENISEETSSVAAPEIIVKIEPDVVVPSTKAPERKALNFIKLPDSLNFDRCVHEIYCRRSEYNQKCFFFRFVSEKDLVVVKEEKVKVEPKKIEVKRTRTAWLPCSLLYEKMNIAEPSGGYAILCSFMKCSLKTVCSQVQQKR